MTKKVSFGAKPSAQPANPDQWVKDRATQEKEPTKRLTIDIPESLHRTIKSQCASEGVKIADEVRKLLINRFEKNK